MNAAAASRPIVRLHRIAVLAALVTLVVVGGRTLLTVILHELTERQRLVERLQRSEAWFRALIQQSRDVTSVVARDGTRIYVSPSVEWAAGYRPDELVGEPVTLNVMPEDAAMAERFHADAIAAPPGGGVSASIRTRHRDGSLRWWELTATNLLDDPAVGGIVVTAYDLTERRRQEEELRRLNQGLLARTAELEAANRELEAFSYSISHDLRAPLRAMDGFARVLQEDFTPHLPDERQEYLQIVRDSAQRMGQLVDALLAFSRLGRQPLAKRLVLPADLVRRVFSELATEWEGRRVDLIVGDLPACWGDAALLEQVYANLLGNALKFTRPREAATVEVGWSADAARPGGGAHVVRDNGVGFDMRYVDKLFGVFQRLHGREAFEGTGVGLAIVQRIIHRHGGAVGAVGEPDRGATFWFSLPAAGADADSAADPAIAPDGANRSH